MLLVLLSSLAVTSDFWPWLTGVEQNVCVSLNQPSNYPLTSLCPFFVGCAHSLNLLICICLIVLTAFLSHK